jgi:Holliday junction resolvase RusA-like endonuclease
MTRSILITIPGRPPTPNARRNWRVTARDNARWKEAAVEAADGVVPDDWTPLERASVRVTFIVPDRRPRDLDNLVASSKPLTDGVVLAGVLAGDSINHIVRAEYATRYEPGVTATEYLIEEAA